ncbi:MAG: TonB-dependent receptor [Cytophagales bacterium]
MKKNAFTLFYLFISALSIAQNQTQTIKGRVFDKSSQFPLVGVTVSLADSEVQIVTETDIDGNYRLANVPIGRHKIQFSYLSYKLLTISEIVVTSAKESVINASLEESIQEINEVTINALGKDQTVNDMAIISARSFTVEEADRYASSRQDPARMAGNFAGVNSTSDARNDIVVRGNSPLGLLWRLNDIDIPNPNHFAIAGSTGGPVSAINTKFLARSDFMTGAFAAEYGNANAGVFDLKMRNGNNEKHEFTGQFGVLGTELAAEGPFKKRGKSSYLATFRYSTLQLLQGLRLRLGTDAVPNYWDYSFRINMPTLKSGTFSVFAIGGVSSIDIILSNTDKRPQELYGDQNRDQYFRTQMGVFGAQHVYFFNPKTHITSTLSQSYQKIDGWHELIYRDSATYKLTDLKRILGFDQLELRTSFNQNIQHKINSRLSMKAGYYFTWFNFNIKDRVRNDGVSAFQVRANATNNYIQVQPFAQFKYRATEKLTFHAGLHGQYVSINNNSFSVEPRAGVNYNFSPKHTISFGYGLHSQMQQNYLYFFRTNPNNTDIPNKNLGYTRSQHFIASYDYNARPDLRFKIEAYYQNLWDIPVYPFPSGVSLINSGASFSRFFAKAPMVNKGVGQNYGLEFTVEKFFSKNYYVLWTTSLYQSKYRGSDNTWRNTDFNGNYVTNLLAGYEKTIGKKKNITLIVGTKLSLAGGRRYSPADIDSSNKYLDYQVKEDSINTLQFQDYVRWDLRLGIRINALKLTHELMIDLVNVLNIKNPLALTYAPDPTKANVSPIQINYQLGFLPLLYYKVDF